MPTSPPPLPEPGSRRLRIAAKRLLRALANYDHGWPHPESEIHDAMKEVRDALAH